MFNLIIVPQGAEYQAVRKGLNQLKTAQPKIVAIPIGVQQIESVLTSQNFGDSPPQKILMMGLCGSLSSQYGVGDIVLYDNCCSQKNPKILITDKHLNRFILEKVNEQNNTLTIALVSGLTSDRVVTTITEKRQLAEGFTANVVDMESFAYLQLFQNQEIAVSILRIVSDDLQYNLPNLEQAISKNGKIKSLAMAKIMLQQPISSLRLIKGSLQGLNRLQEVTTKIFKNH